MPYSVMIIDLLGVFLLVVGGVLVGLFLLTIEIVFKRRKERQEKEGKLSRTAMIQWRKIDVRDPQAKSDADHFASHLLFRRIDSDR